VRDHHHRLCIVHVVGWPQRATEERWRAQHVERATRDERLVHITGDAVLENNGFADAVVADSGDLLQGPALASKRLNVGRAVRIVGERGGSILEPRDDQPILVADGKWTEQHALNQGKHRCCRADAHRQRQHGHNAERLRTHEAARRQP
jgi:hypothetical protein